MLTVSVYNTKYCKIMIYKCMILILEKLSKVLLGLNVIGGLTCIVSVPDQSEDVIRMALQVLLVLLDYG